AGEDMLPALPDLLQSLLECFFFSGADLHKNLHDQLGVLARCNSPGRGVFARTPRGVALEFLDLFYWYHKTTRSFIGTQAAFFDIAIDGPICEPQSFCCVFYGQIPRKVWEINAITHEPSLLIFDILQER